jgi:hypothetical protein
MMDKTKNLADLAAFAVAAGSWLEYLPYLAAAFSVVWLLIRIYEWAKWVRSGRKGPPR